MNQWKLHNALAFFLDWLVLHNAHEKQVALLSGYVQNTPNSFGRNDKWKCLSAPGFYLELHAPVIKIKPAGKIFINNNDDQMNCSSVIFSYFWDHNFRSLFFVTRVGKIISLREPPFTVLGTNRTPKCFQFLNRSSKAKMFRIKYWTKECIVYWFWNGKWWVIIAW